MVSLFDLIKERCDSYYHSQSTLTPEKMAIEIMKGDEFIIHSPYHHYIVPAVLITAAAIKEELDEKTYNKYMEIAKSRSSKVPGAYCGEYGACGAALGEGIFASIWTGTTPMSADTLGLVHKITADGLDKIGDYSGPRCCKRVTFLAIESGAEFAREHMGINIKTDKITCTFCGENKECIRKECKFFGNK